MRAYYGSRLSENMTVTPEGYLICLNVPIARTGTQMYLRSELGIYDDDPNGLIEVYRTEEEVFSPATIASFEGKPVTDDHPAVGVCAENITAFDNGHAQNVRRGTGEESDLLLGDLFITAPKLIEAIRNGRREVSCGYDCEYVEVDGKLYQRGIRGNHVAVVEAGRAGHRVAIKDSAEKQENEERGKRKMAKKHSMFAKMFGLAVKDMEPDEVADAIEELTNSKSEDEEPAPAAPAAEAPSTDGGDPIGQQILAALNTLNEKISTLCAAQDCKDNEPETPAPADEDPLQKLADELEAEAKQEQNPSDEEAAATIPADEMPDDTTDEDGPEAAAATLPENPIPGADSKMALQVINSVRSIFATLPAEQRKAASDKATAEIRKMLGRDATPKTNAYNGIANVMRQASKAKAKDGKPKQDNGEIGRKIMESRNPHYKK